MTGYVEKGVKKELENVLLSYNFWYFWKGVELKIIKRGRGSFSKSVGFGHVPCGTSQVRSPAYPILFISPN